MDLKGFLVLAVLTIIITTIAIIYQSNASRVDSLKPFASGSSILGPESGFDKNPVMEAGKSPESPVFSVKQIKSDDPKETGKKDQPNSDASGVTTTLGNVEPTTDPKSLGKKVFDNKGGVSKERSSNNTETPRLIPSKSSSTEPLRTTKNPISDAPQAPTQPSDIVKDSPDNKIINIGSSKTLKIGSDITSENAEPAKGTIKLLSEAPQIDALPKEVPRALKGDTGNKGPSTVPITVPASPVKSVTDKSIVENAESSGTGNNLGSDAPKVTIDPSSIVDDGLKPQRTETSKIKRLGSDESVEKSEQPIPTTNIIKKIPKITVQSKESVTDTEVYSAEAQSVSTVGSDKVIQTTEPSMTSTVPILESKKVLTQQNLMVKDGTQVSVPSTEIPKQSDTDVDSTTIGTTQTVSGIEATVDDDITTDSSNSSESFSWNTTPKGYDKLVLLKSNCESVLAGYERAIATLKKEKSLLPRGADSTEIVAKLKKLGELKKRKLEEIEGYSAKLRELEKPKGPEAAVLKQPPWKLP